ncbi:MAG: hypothetical protein CMH57_15390 [Myxococcales bacterium]|nr:hypothetical protein [Myxococcales bacterium]
MRDITRWLKEIGRGIYLPLDLMIVLLEHGHDELGQVIASNTVGTVSAEDVLARLKELGREIEDRSQTPAELERDAFSRSFARILEEACEQARARKAARVTEEDLLRAVMWRAEVTESASVRWAIKRLAEGGGDRLFDGKNRLKRDAFNEVAWGFLQAAMQLAARSGTPFLGTPHLIAALCSVKESVMWRAASSRGLEPSRLREELLRIIGVKAGPLPDFILGRKTLTPRMVRMLSYARTRARKEDAEELVGEPHLVQAFLYDGGSSLELVQALGLEPEVVKALGEPRVLEGTIDVGRAVNAKSSWESKAPTPTLDMIGRDLTLQARQGKLPRIIGRDRELQRVINVLLRKEQRNPLLTGDAGVGKTALAVALAQRIADADVPGPLQNQRVVEINGASLMSGTSYRGELESRIKGLLSEAQNSVILFIDEAHAVFAPRTSSHSPAEIPNHFKSALASGEIAVVGATTEAEYRRWMEQDPALKRRFERVEIGEPKPELTMAILRDLSAELEEDYKVKVQAEAIEGAMEYSSRYLPEQRLPDKAKKLLMDAAIATAHPVGPSQIPEQRTADGVPEVTRMHVAHQIAHRTGIPVDRLIRGESGWWSGIVERLEREMLGQRDAVQATARALVAGRLNPAAEARPLAVLVFFGPPGVGKGTLARMLAVEVFGDARAFLRLDMTDFAEAHTLSRLIGSPPGYVGYEDEDMFVTPLRRRPGSVVLLEDIDKAHPRVLDRLLRVFNEGEISDTRGLSADARQAIFILNVTTDAESRAATRIGFGSDDGGGDANPERAFRESRQELHARLKGHVDAFIPFRPLNEDDSAESFALFVERHLEQVSERIAAEYGLRLSWSDAALKHLVEACRGVQVVGIVEVIQARLVAPLTELLITGDASQGDAVAVDLSDGELTFAPPS